MDLVAFRIQMFRNVIDSGWVEIEPLTVLVGKNESGKTSLMRALYKFNPSASDEAYDISNEWPRTARETADTAHDVCIARFRLSDADVAALSDIAGKKLKLKLIEVARDYAGSFSVHLPEDDFPDVPSAVGISQAWSTWPALPKGVSESFEHEISQVLKVLQDASASSDLTELLTSELATITPQAGVEQQFVATLPAHTVKVSKALAELPSIASVAQDHVLETLPTFIYMDDYRAFTGTAKLDEVKSRIDAKRPKDSDRTLLMMMALAGLDLDDQVAKAQQPDKFSRVLDMRDASTRLTNLVDGRWTQGKYLVKFDADAFEFFTFVQVPEREGDTLIKLEERSRGFQWFFSFDLMFTHESRLAFKNCVLLLDEPGLHLHPDGQADLVRRLEAYAIENTVIYTTHLPFMLNLREPQRIRVVSAGKGGSVVGEDLSQGQPEAKLLLQAALGMSLRNSYLVAPRNVVVEGVHDYWILTELSNLLVRSGLKGIAEDAFITPAGGASEAAYLATFLVGQNLDVVLLLDSDKAGDEGAEKLTKSWVTRYKEARIEIIALGPAAGVKEKPVAIEDLFPEAFYLDRVKETYEADLKRVESLPKLQADGLLATRVGLAFAEVGLKFNKGSVAKRIRTSLLSMKTADELPAETKAMAVKIVGAINRALAKASAQKQTSSAGDAPES